MVPSAQSESSDFLKSFDSLTSASAYCSILKSMLCSHHQPDTRPPLNSDRRRASDISNSNTRWTAGRSQTQTKPTLTLPPGHGCLDSEGLKDQICRCSQGLDVVVACCGLLLLLMLFAGIHLASYCLCLP